MKKVFTKEYVRENLDCYNVNNKRLLPLARQELDKLGEKITMKEILTSGIRGEDKFWWIMAHSDINVEELQTLAVQVAEVAVRIYESETSGDKKLGDLLDKAKSGIDTLPEIKAMIIEVKTPISRTGNAVRSVARAVTTLFTEGHKRPLTIKSVNRLLLAAYGDEKYGNWVKDILKNYY